MSLAIAGIGTAVPGNRLTQKEAAAIAREFLHAGDEQLRLLPVLYRRTGVRARHSVLGGWSGEQLAAGGGFYGRSRAEGDRGPTTGARVERFVAEAAPLAAAAAEGALAEAAIDAERITHLVTVSCTGMSAPGFDLELAKRLGLSRHLARSHIGFMGCHGAMNGLRVARAFVEADPRARVLLAAVELCSLHLYYGWDPEKIVANAIFADGAAALVGVPGAEAAADSWQVEASGSHVIADSEDEMTWKIGDHGFEMTLSARVPDLVGPHVRPWLESWLAERGLAVEEVGSWAVHPGGPRILSAFQGAVGLDREALADSWEVLAEYGNMSSPTVLFIVDRLRRRAAPRPAVALGFGPGLTIEAALIR